jgi:hypothetical protein
LDVETPGINSGENRISTRGIQANLIMTAGEQTEADPMTSLRMTPHWGGGCRVDSELSARQREKGGVDGRPQSHEAGGRDIAYRHRTASPWGMLLTLPA